MTTTTAALSAAALPAWFQAKMDQPSFGLSPFTVGSSYDRPGADLAVADHLEALGWAVVRQVAVIPAGATLDDQPHPAAGQTYTWAKATPPNYDRHADPVARATSAAIERTGNSDGAGRGDDPWVPEGPTPWQDLLDAVERGDLLPPF